jgi:protein SCO1/2
MGRELIVLVLACAAIACARHEPPRRYVLQGQVVAVDADRQRITISHGDIPGYMPAMTMTFEVASGELMAGRFAGELVVGTLEVANATGRLVEIAHTGEAPLPAGTNAPAMAAGVLAVGDLFPDAALIDQGNRRRSLSEWKGRFTLVTFIYTRCPLPTYCPLMDQNFATIQRAAAEDPALRDRVRLVSISFDPDVDTPERLAEHAARLRADPNVWTFLTGDRVTVDRLTATLGVGVIRLGDEAADVTHNLRTTLVDEHGRIAKIYSGNDWTPRDVLADLRSALRRP